MISRENANAFKEVYVILNNMESDYYEKIPKEFIKMLEENMNKEYDFKLNNINNFEEEKILRETKKILGYIFINFWATPIQRKVIEKKFEYEKRKK